MGTSLADRIAVSSTAGIDDTSIDSDLSRNSLVADLINLRALWMIAAALHETDPAK